MAVTEFVEGDVVYLRHPLYIEDWLNAQGTRFFTVERQYGPVVYLRNKEGVRLTNIPDGNGDGMHSFRLQKVDPRLLSNIVYEEYISGTKNTL